MDDFFKHHSSGAGVGEPKNQQADADRKRIDAYRKELEEQIKLKDEQKKRIKMEQERYEIENDKDMAAYMGLPDKDKARENNM